MFDLPEQLLLSDLFRHRVRCDQGLDHGPGVLVWMHPPVHRLLGWVTRPSTLRMARDVWRLDQIRAITDQEIFVKGEPSITDQQTVDRLPTLLEADLLNKNSEKIGSIADLVFDPATGKILHYLVSRSHPRLPGASRWRLNKERILDQLPGIVSTSILTLDDLPIVHASVRQNLLKKSRHLRNHFQDIKDRASDRLEGWLEDPPWDNDLRSTTPNNDFSETDPLENWEDDFEGMHNNLSSYENPSHNRGADDMNNILDEEEDPWI